MQVFLTTEVTVAALALVPCVALYLGAAYGRSLRSGLVAAIVSVAFTLVAGAILAKTGFGFSAISPAVQSGTMSQAPWTQYVASHYVMSGWAIWLVKAPIWFGLGACAARLLTLGGATFRMRTA